MDSRLLWRAANIAFVVALIFAAGMLAVALAGLGDPRPVGTLVWEYVPGEYELEAPEAVLAPALPRSFHPPGTLELVAVQVDGPVESAYGLWWGDVRAMVSGSGYAGVWVGDDRIYAWQPFPHVRGPGEQNRLQMVVDDNRLLVRLNDEVVVESVIDAMAPAEVGVRIETFGHGGAVIDVERVRIWEN